ncbi:MAG: hypothetical protein ACRDZR_13215 [Acidimicrobiales bacterium]
MAGVLVCDICTQNPAALVISRTDNGDTVTVCGHCAPATLGEFAQAFAAAVQAASDTDAVLVDMAAAGGEEVGVTAPAPSTKSNGQGRRKRATAAAKATSEAPAAPDRS